MKKTRFVLSMVFLSAISLLSFGISFAYVPTTQDTADIADLKIRLNSLVENNNINLWDFYNQLKNLQTDYPNDDRLDYMLTNLKDYLYNKLYTQKTAARAISKTYKQNFLNQHISWLSLEISDSLQKCTWWYNTLDDISFAYNFPTALTMATWYRESTCSYYLPSNWDGPFQIVSKDYGTGEITSRLFVQTIEDFMDFTKSKFARYDGQLSGNLSYTWFDLDWITNFSSLYNGWYKSGNLILPNNPNYLFDGYWQDYSWATKYGIFPQFLKALERELQD